MELKLLQANITNNVDSDGTNYGHNIGLFVDVETGVEYFVMNRGNAGAICPRVDRDGKPVVMGGCK